MEFHWEEITIIHATQSVVTAITQLTLFIFESLIDQLRFSYCIRAITINLDKEDATKILQPLNRAERKEQVVIVVGDYKEHWKVLRSDFIQHLHAGTIIYSTLCLNPLRLLSSNVFHMCGRMI